MTSAKRRFVVVDSCGWIEAIKGSSAAALFQEALADPEQVIVPAIVLYEVTKHVLREAGETEAMKVASAMQACVVVPVDASLALSAMKHKLALADSLIYATALEHGAILLTQDAHFAGLPSVQYQPKPKTRSL